MASKPGQLVASRRLLPLFVAHFLGAVNDNLFKNAIALLTIFKIAVENDRVLVAAAAGVFIAPFFLFSATAGQIADRYEKAWLVRRIKAAELLIMATGVLALYAENVPLMLLVLFCTGTQSTFLGPVRYGYLPEHLKESELVTGNAVMEGGFFVATLVGTVAAGVLILRPEGVFVVACAMMTLSVLGFLASLKVPAGRASDPSIRVNPNIAAETLTLLRYAGRNKPILYAILGLSWYWLVGTFYIAQFPGFTRDVINGTGEIGTLLLTVFTVGVGLGAVACERVQRGRISTAPVSLAAVGITIFSIDLSIAAVLMPNEYGPFAVREFLEFGGAWRIMIDVGMIGFCGGFFIVPLNSFIQHRAEPTRRARVVAANYIVNAIFMVVGALGAAALLAIGFGETTLFFGMGLANLAVAVLIVRALPDDFLRLTLWCVFRVLYRIEIKGVDNVEAAGSRVLIVANHVSAIDVALIFSAFPKKPVSAVAENFAKVRWLRPLLRVAEVESVPLNDTLAVRRLSATIRQGRPVLVFPEGRVSTTGHLGKLYDGPAVLADRADAAVLPLRIDGAERSRFANGSSTGLVRRLFPKITLTVGPPRRLTLAPGLSGPARRQALRLLLDEIMSEAVFSTELRNETLFRALRRASWRYGRDLPVLEDIESGPLSYRGLIYRSLVLARVLVARTRDRERVGVLLPNMAPTVIAFFALHLLARVPAMLNPTAGPGGVMAAVRLAGIRQVITSRRFVERAGLEPVIEALRPVCRVIFLEDLRAEVVWQDHLGALLDLPVSGWWHRERRLRPHDPAVILFTSGSEREPKGVVLSSRNLLAVAAQARARVDFGPGDRVFNALPLFHSFGLGIGTLLPLVSGMRTKLYPSPLRFKEIPEEVHRHRSTILFGTDTFLRRYGEAADPLDFQSLRYVFAGGERLRDETQTLYQDKFGLRVLEGYGATETSALMTMNTPKHFKRGTVGRALPGLLTRIERVPGLERGGRLLVKGPNVMRGYLAGEGGKELRPPQDGWHDTGDVVELDGNGHLAVVGRVRRFVKIAGEMVSLALVEEVARAVAPEGNHAAIGRPDPRRGERIVLMTDSARIDAAALHAVAKARGLPELVLPNEIVLLERLPQLASGKIDYVALGRALARAA